MVIIYFLEVLLFIVVQLIIVEGKVYLNRMNAGRRHTWHAPPGIRYFRIENSVL